MSKNEKKGKSIFKSIYNFFDKILITPISKLVYKIGKLLNKNNGKLEKFLNKSSTLLYLSLALALIFFFLINSKVISFVENEAEIINNQPIKVEYNKEAYVIEDLPETVDITLIGRKSDLYLAKQLGENEVVLDLTDYEPRNEPYRVKLTYNQTINTLSYKLDPTYVYVTIKRKVAASKTIEYDVINQDKLNDINPQLSVSKVELNQSEVVVKGSQDTLDKIASVKALVDLNNPKFTQANSYELENLPIVAYDGNGKILNNVEVVPETISGVVTFSSYSKSVPVKVLTTGDLVAGKAISSITINGKSDFNVTIYGEQSAVDKITEVPVTIDVTDQGNNGAKTFNVTIAKPAGVRYMTESTASIVANFGEAKQKTVEVTTIDPRNVPDGMSVNARTESDKKVSVQVIGVESVINEITDKDITAYVDLTGYTAGEHTVPVQVEGSDSRAQFIVTSSINIYLSQNK